MNISKRFLKAAFFLTGISLLFSCATQQNLNGFWGGELAFSEYEKMTSNLLLESDSTFFYLSQPLEGVDPHGFVGCWDLKDGILVLDAGKSLQLMLMQKSDKLELLDFEGKEVIGQKKLVLEKQLKGDIFGQKFIASGRFHHFADASDFRFCGSDKLFTVAMTAAHIDAERMFLEQLDSNAGAVIYLQALMSFEMLPGMEGGQFRQLVIHKVLSQISVCD